MCHDVVANALAKQKPSNPPGQQQLPPNHLPILSRRWIIDAFQLRDTLIKIEKGRKPLSGTDRLDLVERE